MTMNYVETLTAQDWTRRVAPLAALSTQSQLEERVPAAVENELARLRAKVAVHKAAALYWCQKAALYAMWMDEMRAIDKGAPPASPAPPVDPRSEQLARAMRAADARP